MALYKEIILRKGDPHVIIFSESPIRYRDYEGEVIADLKEIVGSNEPKMYWCMGATIGYISIKIYKSNDKKEWTPHFEDTVYEKTKCYLLYLDNRYRYWKITWRRHRSAPPSSFKVIYYPKGFSLHKKRYKERGIEITTQAEKDYELILGVLTNGYKIEKTWKIPKGQDKVLVLYDDTQIPTRKYTVSAYLKYKDKIISQKAVSVNKLPSRKIFEIYFNKLYRSILYAYKEGDCTVRTNNGVYTYCGSAIYITNNSIHLKAERHGAGEYLTVIPIELEAFIEAGFDYTFDVKVIEQASFYYDGSYSCVSYPNKVTKAFVNMCTVQDDIWDYTYHDKAEPEVRIYLGGKLIYNTIMTGAYRGRHGWISDTYVTDTFTLRIKQKDEYTYTWEVSDFKRETGKSGRVVLANVNILNKQGEFKLGGTIGEDVIGRKVDVRNAIPLKIELYSRVGRPTDVDYSAWPYSRAELYINIKEVY